MTLETSNKIRWLLLVPATGGVALLVFVIMFRSLPTALVGTPWFVVWGVVVLAATVIAWLQTSYLIAPSQKRVVIWISYLAGLVTMPLLHLWLFNHLFAGWDNLQFGAMCVVAIIGFGYTVFLAAKSKA